MADGETIRLQGPLMLELPDGSKVRIRPGPYGKGIAVIPVAEASKSAAPRQPGVRGRRPRPGTVALREQLERDAKKGKLKENPIYVKWILQRDEGLSLAVARQIVYRERRRVEKA